MQIGDSKATGRDRIFFGWWIDLACVIGISTGVGPFAFAATGLFIIPFAEEFGWSRTEVSASLTFLTIATAASLPVIGKLVDRFGARRILLPSMVVLGLCLLSIPLLMSEYWHLLLIFTIIGTLGAGANSVPHMRVIVAWFDRFRGLAIGIAQSGIGLGYAYVPVVVLFMIDRSGWRAGYYALAAIIFCVGLPVIYRFMRETPQEMGLHPDGIDASLRAQDAAPDSGFTPKQAVRTREFWILFLMFILLAFVLNGTLPHLVPLLTDRGATTASAALAASLVGVTVMISRVGIGYLIDRFFAPRVALFFFLLSAIGIGMLAAGATGKIVYLSVIFIGFSLGAEFDLLAYMTSRYFGARCFGQVYGFLFGAILIGTAFGPVAFGIDFDLRGSYVRILWVSCLTNLVVCGLVACLGPYRDWKTDDLG